MSVLAHSLDSHRTKDVILDENVTFENLFLNKCVLKGLSKSGFKKPSPIQIKAIPVGRCGFDLIVKSKSGTGKTLVYTVVALETVDTSKNEIEVLIIVPTREIAVQIEEVLLTVGRYIEGLQVKCFIGGLPLDVDRENCKNCQIAIGTPGRVKHLITEGILKTDLVRLFVLDEVDKLMECSFLNDINEIYNNLPSRIQIITTSATYAEELKVFLEKYMLSPTYVGVENNTPFLWGLKQFLLVVKQHTNVVQQMKIKTEELLKIFSNVSFTQCIIFTNYQVRAESISNTLNQKGWASTFVSAARSQHERLAAVKDLKDFNCKIMLSTDLTARGIDAANIDLVINYDVPVDATTYLHRMGRAGRYGSSGICINLVSEGAELQQIQGILDKIGGSSLSVSKLLPNSDVKLPDLVNVNVLSNDSNMNIRQGIFDMKDVGQELKNQKEEQKHDQLCLMKNSSKNTDVIEGNINDILTNTKEEPELIGKQLGDENTNALLKSLASGEFTLESDSSHQNIDNELQQFILSDKHKSSNIPHTNKTETLLSEPACNKTKELSTREFLFNKNKALLSVSKIISEREHSKTEQNNVDCIDIYLKISKEQEIIEVQDLLGSGCQNEIEILKNIDQCKPQENANSVTNNHLETAFKKAYDFATKPTARHWRTYFPDSQKRLNTLPLEEQIDDNSIEYSIIADVASLDNDVSEDENVEETPDNFMKWVPVETSENPSGPVLVGDTTSGEHFYQYFNNCSEHLWQNGLYFESIEDFDNWFYEWQVGVASVRNYVQQNIYLQEMNNYQQYKRNYLK